MLEFWSRSKVKLDPSVPVVSYWMLLVSFVKHPDILQSKCLIGHDRWKAALGSSFGHQAGWFIFTPGKIVIGIV